MAVYQMNYMDYQDLSLIEIGDQKCGPLYSFGPFIRNEYIFHYVISGKGYVSCNDRSSAPSLGNFEGPDPLTDFIPVKAGEGFLIEPHTKHIYYADENEPWHYIWVVFKGLSVPRYLRKCGFSKTNILYQPKDYSVRTSQKIRQHLSTILENTHEEPVFIIGHFSLFIASLIENVKQPDFAEAPNQYTHTALADHYMNQAISFINTEHSKIRSLDEIADFCHISRSHLGRLFRNHLHISLQDYLTQFRLNKAKELLVTTTYSVNEIALAVGYQTELNMLRAFKKAYNLSPSKWRSQNML